MMEKTYKVEVKLESNDITEVMEALEDIAERLDQGKAKIGVNYLSKTIGYWRYFEESRCEHCHGTGEVTTDEDDGEGHIMSGVGTQKCICQK